MSKRTELLSLGVFSLALLFPPGAGAVFIREELELVESEPQFDSEYFLDLLGFSYPLEWKWAWEASSPTIAGYRVNAASLDCCSLLLQQDLTFRLPLTNWLSFRYDLEQNGDKDLEEFHQWAAFEVGPWQGLKGRVFGEPTPSKEDSDIGGMLLYEPFPSFSLYGSFTAVDWNFNERGLTNQSYEKKPLTYEAGLLYSSGRDRWRVSGEWDLPLTFLDPAQNLKYRYRKTVVTVLWDRPLKEGSSKAGFSGSYRYESKNEAQTFDPDPALATLDFSRKVHALSAASVFAVSSRSRLELGAQVLKREASSRFLNDPSADKRFRRWEVQPYGRWRRKLKPWAVWETAFFLSRGEINSSDLLEAKLGLGIDFLFSSRNRIGIHGSFDLDEITTHFWDGGSVRVQFFF